MLKTADGRLFVVSGSSRCGKTTKVWRDSRGFATVFYWDIEAQFCKQQSIKKISNINELIDIVKKGIKGKFAYVPIKEDLKGQFEIVCACVMHYGSHFGQCAFVAEELADVTTTAKAPPSWGMLIRRGLKRSITIYAISQRWAEADKTALGNATDFYLFRMASGDDMRYMAQKTRVPVSRMEELKPLEYIHYNALTGETKGSKITF